MPAGASIDPATGVFSWTPSEAQGPGTYTFDVVVSDDGTPNLSDSETITVTVNEVNVAPVLGAIGNQTVDELALLSFTATASDVDDPANTLTLQPGRRRGGSVPAGATIDPAPVCSAGRLPKPRVRARTPSTWWSPTTARRTCRIAKRSRSRSTEVNVAPVLGAIGNQTVDELAQLSFTATASDVDAAGQHADLQPGQRRGGSVPAGATIDPAPGVFSWTPDRSPGPGHVTPSTWWSRDNGTPESVG